MQHSIWTACFRDEYICKYGKALINRKFPFPQMRKGKFDSIYLRSASPTAHEKSFTIPASFENARESVQTGTQLHTCDKNWRWTAYPCHVLAAGLPECLGHQMSLSHHTGLIFPTSARVRLPCGNKFPADRWVTSYLHRLHFPERWQGLSPIRSHPPAGRWTEKD